VNTYDPQITLDAISRNAFAVVVIGGLSLVGETANCGSRGLDNRWYGVHLIDVMVTSPVRGSR
jgi:hypothetical protein